MNYLLLWLAVSMATWSLWANHSGPVFWYKKIVLFGKTPRYFGLFDVIRVFTGRLWLNKQGIFIPSLTQHALWSCPFCLSFWVQLPFIALFEYQYDTLNTFEAAALIFALPLFSGWSVLLHNHFIDKLHAGEGNNNE